MKNIQILPVLIILISGCSTLPHSIKPIEQDLTIPSQSVYIVSHGWHTNIVYPRERLLSLVPELEKRFPSGEYLEIGWGDMGFYQANEITTAITLRAVFLLTDSVLHIVAVQRSPYESFPNSDIRPLCLSQAQIQSLGRFISNSFFRDKKNHLVATKKGIYGDSQFYNGVGSYYLFNTCNKWTAKGLESAGFEINTTLKLTASSILNYIAAIENHDEDMLTDTLTLTPQAVLCR